MSSFSFSVTEYKGFEKEVLHLRNKNRSNIVNQEYMNWRYSGHECERSSLVFWVNDECGKKVGMVGMAFRPYWVKNKILNVSVIGDISLNSELRGQGIGRELFIFMNSYIKKEQLLPALVIPNTQAGKSLTSSGWKTPEQLLPHVFLINPSEKISRFIKNKCLSNVCGKIFQKILSTGLRLWPSDNGISLERTTEFCRSFDLFWAVFPKEGVIIRDRSSSMLAWRYLNHPELEFETVIVKKCGEMIGYVVYNIDKERELCAVYDFLTFEKREKAVIIEFIKHILTVPDVRSVRILLNQNHPYSEELRQVGFVRRSEMRTFQIFSEDSVYEGIFPQWFINYSDKDT